MRRRKLYVVSILQLNNDIIGTVINYYNAEPEPCSHFLGGAALFSINRTSKEGSDGSAADR